SGVKSSARAHSNKNAFFLSELPRTLDSVRLGDIDYTVYACGIKYFGQIGCWPATYSWYGRSLCGLTANNLNAGVFLFKKHGTPHNRPCCTHCTYKVCDFSFGIAPDLRSG